MRMHSEEGPEAGKSGENGEAARPDAPEVTDISIGQKYRELKSKLKYLIYEHRCYESELSKAQNRLVQLSRDKTVLLDQLLQYEPVSDEEETMTNYSASDDETADKPKQQTTDLGRQASSIKSGTTRLSRSPVATTTTSATTNPPSSSSSSSHLPAKPSSLTKQGIAKATAIINSVSNNINSKTVKAGTKRQAKHAAKAGGGGGAAGGGAAVKISKTVSRVRHNMSLQDEAAVATPTLEANNTAGGVSKQKLVVSYPIDSIESPPPNAGPATVTTTTLPASAAALCTSHSAPNITLTTPTTVAPPPPAAIAVTIAATKTISRPVPALTKVKPFPSASSSAPPPSSSATLLVSSSGSIHVSTLSSAPNIPPLIPPLIPDPAKSPGKPLLGLAPPQGKPNSSTSSSGSSSSSSDSDSAESGSDLTTESEDEAMETESGPVGRGGGGGGGGPVQIVSSVKNSSNLPRPKAILSPVKMTPPMLVRGGAGGGGSVATTPPTTVVSPQPAFASWSSQSSHTPVAGNAGETVPSLTPGAEVGGVFAPPVVASPLSSPPASVLPFSSSLSNPGASSGAFQVFSPKRVTPATPPSSSQQASSLPPALLASSGPASTNSPSATHPHSKTGANPWSDPNSTGHPNLK